jgi:hypothetical protein
LPVCANLCRAFGRSPQATAWLEAFSQPQPRLWEAEAQAEADARNGELDLVLEEEIAELEESDVCLQSELHASFVLYDEPEADEAVGRSYAFERVPAPLERALSLYEQFRISPVNRLRNGSAVVPLTIAHDRSTTLRFLGWLQRTHAIAPCLQSVFGSPEVGARVEEFVGFLRQERGCRWSTCANYLSGASCNG